MAATISRARARDCRRITDPVNDNASELTGTEALTGRTMQMNDSKSPPSAPSRPKLTVRGLEPSDVHYWFVWVVGRRAPRCRYSTKAAAMRERDRLRATGLDARVYEAHAVEADK